MIFLNRRRTPLKQKTTKDPSKYWYVEKYVYGVLKETVEVALGEGIKFTGVESGYIDDEFAGWSKTSTSTTRTFNTTTTYKNTTTAVKKLLDSENTIKLYAVYRVYTVSTNGKSFSLSGNGIKHKLVATEDATLTLSGYEHKTIETVSNGTGSTTTRDDEVVFNIFNVDGTKKEAITTGKNSNKTTDVITGEIVEVSTVNYSNLPSGGNGVPSDGTYYAANSVSVKVSSTGEMQYYKTSTKYRVASHT